MRKQQGRRPAAQAGFTLIEVLLVVALSAVIFAPLMLWVGLAINQQPIIKDGILRTASAGLLGSYFPKDVAVAGQATVEFDASPPSWAADCSEAASAGAGASNAGGGGKRQVAMIAGGTDVYKVIYSAAPAAADSAKQSLWRRTCNAATNLLITSTEVFADIQPGLTKAICTSESGDKPCRQITISVTPTSTGRVVTVQGTRRVDEGALPLNLSGVAVPTAIIQVTSQAGSPLVVGLSAARSSVGAGRTPQYKWEVSGPSSVSPQPSSTAKQISATFVQQGSYSVILTVTDDLGNTSYGYQEISTTNRAPTAVAVVSPASGVGGTVFTLDGAGSSDLEGSISTYDWIVKYPSSGLQDGKQETPSGSTATVRAPADAYGRAEVTLIVTDDQGAQGFTYTKFEITNPSGPTTTVGPGGSTTTTINPAGPSALSVSFTNVAGPGAFGQTFKASATTASGAESTASYSWEFGDGTTKADDAAPVHTYLKDGQYNVKVTASASGGRTATTARVINVGGAPPPVPSVAADQLRLVWAAVPGARRYLVDFEWRTDADCFEQRVDQQVAVSPAPSKAIPANLCSRFATSRARVGTDANGTVSWSEWIPVPLVGS